jgi:hypothetical protein
MRRNLNEDISKISQPIYAQITDSGSARRDESNDMCLEAGQRFLPEIASAHAHSDETHVIRFVSTS